jgi:hypothetical protein
MLTRLARHRPGTALARDCRDARTGPHLPASAAQPAQIALEKRVRVEADSAPVGNAVAGIFPQQRAQRVHPARVKPLEPGETRELRFERVERRALVIARVDQHRHLPSDRAKFIRRIVEKRPAGQRQRAHQPVAERVMEHGRASPRSVKADLLLGFEHEDARIAGERGGRRQSGNPTADHQDVGAAHAAVRRPSAARSRPCRPSSAARP